MFDEMKCHNYTIIDDDDCELGLMETMLKLRLAVTSTSVLGLEINSSNAVTTVTIDDRGEPECFVDVGYTKTSYTLSEDARFATICVNSVTKGIEERFSLNSTLIGETLGFLKHYAANFAFSLDSTNSSDTQCFNLSADFNAFNICSTYFTDCATLDLRMELIVSDNSSRVSFFDGRNVTNVVVMPPAKCTCGRGSSNNIFVAGMTAATVVLSSIVMIGIAIAIVVVCHKRRKKVEINKEMNEFTSEHIYHSLGESWRATLLQHLKYQLSDKRLIYSKDQIILSTTVGQGESGLVYKAYIKTAVGKELVAVKTGKALFSKFDFERLAKEVSTMLSFDHPNVMCLIGVCIDGEMPLLIMPFMSNGSTLDFIRHHKSELCTQTATKTLLGICHQISKGMEYLSLHKFVHRDLAARNCMIDGNGVIKVADFGLTEEMYNTNYFRQERGEGGNEEKVPIRWMAPESIENDIYNEATDVWSFGVTMWEVFTCGSVPYAGVHVMGLLKELQRGERLEKPDNVACNDEIYKLMLSYWSDNVIDRLTFHDLARTLDSLLETESGYLELSESLKWRDATTPPLSSPGLGKIDELDDDTK